MIRLKLTLICGHYGCGKTNFALNLAEQFSGKGKTVICDMDVVNPYFRTSDYMERLQSKGIDVVAPVFAGTTVDAPCLSPSVFSVFDSGYDYAIFDIGGDDAGATSVSQYARIISQYDYEMLYVINKFRAKVASPQDALAVLREIESACRLKATGIVNNSHLCGNTAKQDVLSSFSYAGEVARLCGLPVKYTLVENRLAGEFGGRDDIFPVERIVLPDWGNEQQ